jgi:UDP-N-acetylglucosamine 1-carboxyvinyltransferase
VSDERHAQRRVRSGMLGLAGARSVVLAGADNAMERFVITGGAPLSGTVIPAGNKNAALPILAASVLTDEVLELGNVPRIRDVDTMLEILEGIGVSVTWRGENELSLCGAGVEATLVEPEFAEQIRASFLLAGPLLARFGKAEMPPPGGDFIGRRRLDPHIDGFRALGAHCDYDGTFVLSAPKGLRAADVFMDEPSVMGTENVLMAAALTPGTTVISNAACEPHVQDLARLLVKMGAAIEGIGSNVLTVHGAEQLGGARHDIAPDHIEIGSFMALAGVTGGQLRIKDTNVQDLRMIRIVFDQLGLHSELDGNDVIVPGRQRLVVKSDVGDYKRKVMDGPWPAFPADLTSIAVALATQAHGSVLIHEWMFESRLIFTDKLAAMGADIVSCDPHRAIVTGPRRLRGARLESPDIRAGMAMLIAALCADGRSEIGSVEQIDKGYERIDERLRDLGAQIERVPAEPSLAL